MQLYIFKGLFIVIINIKAYMLVRPVEIILKSSFVACWPSSCSALASRITILGHLCMDLTSSPSSNRTRTWLLATAPVAPTKMTCQSYKHRTPHF